MQELYNSFHSFLKNKFKHDKIRKIPIDAGFSCPNKDGRISTEGCIFCDEYGSGPIKSGHLGVQEQLELFIAKRHGEKFIAYFQANTNTAAKVDELRKQYEKIFLFEDIVALFIGTRPDSIDEPVYKLLDELNKRIYLSLEIGLQSIHEKSLKFLTRNHSYQQFLDTFFRLKELSIDVVVHLIVGIPGETEEDMMATIDEMNRLKPAGIKFHLLHILKNTALLKLYEKKPFKLLEEEEYINIIVNMLERLNSEIVIHRLTGERDAEIFYAPEWTLNRSGVLQAIRNRMKEMNTFQGRLCGEVSK